MMNRSKNGVSSRSKLSRKWAMERLARMSEKDIVKLDQAGIKIIGIDINHQSIEQDLKSTAWSK